MIAATEIIGSTRGARIVRRHASAFSTACVPSVRVAKQRRFSVAVKAYTVELKHAGGIAHLDVPEGESILSVAIDAGLEVPHDCKLGVCMNCAAKLVSCEVCRRKCIALGADYEGVEKELKNLACNPRSCRCLARLTSPLAC